MQHGFISAAAGSPMPREADCAYNAEQVIAARRAAIENNAAILLLPALCLTGASCGEKFLQNTLIDDAARALNEVLRASADDGLLTFVGLPLPIDGKLYNCVAALRKGEILGIVPERSPNGVRSKYFAPCGGERATLYVEGNPAPFGSGLLFVCGAMPSLVIGVAFSPYETQELAAAGATLIVYPESGPSPAARYAKERAIRMAQSAICHTAALHAAPGLCDSPSEGVFAGGALVIEDGRLLAEAPRFSASIAVSEIDMERVEHGRRSDGAYKPSACVAGGAPVRISFEMDKSETELTRAIPPLPFVPEYAPDWAARCEEVFLLAAHALSARIRRTNAKRVVLGMSGGLGSTLAALTASSAMSLLNRPTMDVLAVLMPGFSTGARSSANARQTANLLGFSIREIDIRPPVTQGMEMTGGVKRDGGAFGNAEARERANLLFNIADSEGGFVLDARDMTDAAMGTREDGIAAWAHFSATGGIPKTLARAMIQHVAKFTPDGDLRDTLSDVLETPVESEEGDFELHDFFMYYTLRWGFTPEKLLRLAARAFGDKYGEEESAAALGAFLERYQARDIYPRPETARVGTVFVD